jgi:nitroreductase
MGYDSCPMIGFDFEAVAQIIDLPEEHDIVMGVAWGLPGPRPTQNYFLA